MRHFAIYILLSHLSLIVFSQVNCSQSRFSSKQEFKQKDITTAMNVVYGQARNWKGETDTLRMDFFFPSAEVDQMKKRPFILLMHPSGFAAGKRQLMHNKCMLLASKGYVTATISYRLGWYTGAESDCNGNMEMLKDAMYRAFQDAKAALRYSVAHAPEYGIDTSWIFIGGESAGGATSLHVAFCNEEELANKFENQPKKFGPVNTATNNLKNTYTIKGVANMWGGLLSDMAIGADNKIPTIMFHGEKDKIVPFYVAPFNGCYAPVAYPIVHGSQSLAKRFKSHGVCYQLHSVPDGVHGVYDEVYLTDHIACFFKSVMCGNCKTLETHLDPTNCSTP